MRTPAAPSSARLLVLVGPAAVVGHRLAVEQLGIELRRVGGVRHLRIVDQHDDGLALDVDALEVVPVVFGRGRRRSRRRSCRSSRSTTCRRPAWSTATTSSDHLKVCFCAPFVTVSGCACGAGDPDERHFLHVGAVGVAGLQPELLRLVGQVPDRQVFPLGARRAPFVLVGGEHLDPLEDGVLVDR